MPRLSESFIENFEVSLIFFVLDIILIVLFLPLTLGLIERRKWAPMRAEIVTALVAARHQTVRALSGHISRCFEVYTTNRMDVAGAKPIPELSLMATELKSISDDARHYLDFLSPAIEPGMAGPTLEIMRLPQSILRLFGRIQPMIAPLLLHTGDAIPQVRRNDFHPHDAHHTLHYFLYLIFCEIHESRAEIVTLIEGVSLSRSARRSLCAVIDEHEAAEAILRKAIDSLFDLMLFNPNGAKDFTPASSARAAILSYDRYLPVALFAPSAAFLDALTSREFASFVERESFELDLCSALIPLDRRYALSPDQDKA